MESSRYNIPKQLQEINKNNGKMHKWNKNINHEVFFSNVHDFSRDFLVVF